MNDLNEGVQICLICFLLWIYMAVQARNMPYYSKTLNSLQTAVFLLCTAFFIARLVIRNYELRHIVPENVRGTVSNKVIEDMELLSTRRI